MDIYEYQKRVMELGRNTRVLLELHLEDPIQYDALKITESLFVKFEELELEGALDEIVEGESDVLASKSNLYQDNGQIANAETGRLKYHNY